MSNICDTQYKVRGSRKVLNDLLYDSFRQRVFSKKRLIKKAKNSRLELLF